MKFVKKCLINIKKETINNILIEYYSKNFLNNQIILLQKSTPRTLNMVREIVQDSLIISVFQAN